MKKNQTPKISWQCPFNNNVYLLAVRMMRVKAGFQGILLSINIFFYNQTLVYVSMDHLKAYRKLRSILSKGFLNRGISTENQKYKRFLKGTVSPDFKSYLTIQNVKSVLHVCLLIALNISFCLGILIFKYEVQV